MSKLVIYGASGQALVVADIIRLQKKYEIFGFIDNVNLERKNTKFCDSTILGGEEQLTNIETREINNFIVAIGDCLARLQLSNLIEQKGLNLVTAIHPRATVASDVSIDSGAVICAGAAVNPGVTIGKSVIVNTNASVDHECVLEDGVHIGPGVNLGGKTVVKKGAWIGIGATVRDRVTIGEFSIIGTGSVVLKDIPANVVAYGVPAKVIRKID